MIFHLNYEKKMVFCDWVILNQSAFNELGFEAGGLRTISADRNNSLYKELERDFKPGFLNMSTKDEQSLDVHKKTFKDEKRRYSIVAFALKQFSDDVKNWKPAHSSIQYLREQNTRSKKKEDSLDTLLADLIKVYVLDSLSLAMSHVIS